MKIRRLIAVMLMTVLFCTACGQKEEVVTNSTNEDVTADASTEVSTADSVDETEEIQEQEESVDEADQVENEEIEYEEVIGDTDETEYEEVIGDTDANYGEITMNDIVPSELGVVIPMMETDPTGNIQYLTLDDIGLNSLSILFPLQYYVTAQTQFGTEILDVDSGTSFRTYAYVDNYEYREKAKYETHDYGKYIVQLDIKGDDMQVIASIFNIENGTRLVITTVGHMESETGIATIAEYKEAYIADLLAQVEAAAN